VNGQAVHRPTAPGGASQSATLGLLKEHGDGLDGDLGDKVRFKGVATINGSGTYTFKVTADDNGEPGTNDAFKIEIWA